MVVYSEVQHSGADFELTSSVDQGPKKADSFSDDHEIYLVWNVKKVHYHIHEGPLLDHILRKNTPLSHTLLL
jgi:hypothetical protein